MNRSAALVLLAAALVIYGAYHLLWAVTMLPAPLSPLLFVAFAAQGVLGLAAGIGVWSGHPWAAPVVLVLGASIAVTALMEAFVLGILASLYALLIAVAAIVVALIIGAYIQGGEPPRRDQVMG